jgi:hypothetical protein
LVIGIKRLEVKDSYSDCITRNRRNTESCFEVDCKSKSQSIVGNSFIVWEPSLRLIYLVVVLDLTGLLVTTYLAVTLMGINLFGVILGGLA